jgi:GH24 family phage-related lysozyme (muramidase)
MEYQEAKNLRGKKFTDLMTEKLLEGQGVGSSLGKTISEKTKAKVTGIKEAFDPMNIAKKLTFGSNLAPAIYGALFGRSEEDMRYFAGKGAKTKKQKDDVTKTPEKVESGDDDMAVQVLGLIYRLMKRDEDDKRLDLEEARNKLEEQEDEENTRNKELIEAITGRKIKKPPKRKTKEFGEKKDEVPEQETPTEKPAVFRPSPKRFSTTEKAPRFSTGGRPNVPTARPSTSSLATPSAARVLTGITLGTGLLATASSVVAKEEGLPRKGKAYWDPPGQTNLVSIGYGHQIKADEYKQGFILAGDEKIPLSGNKGIDTVLNPEQAQKLLQQDLPKYQNAAAGPLGDSWNKLNDVQKAALISYAYNTGSTQSLVRAGIKDAIDSGNTAAAAAIIRDRGIKTAGGNYNKQLDDRRHREAALFESQPSSETPKASSVPPAPTAGSQIDSSSKENKDLKESLNKTKSNQSTVNNTYSETQSKQTPKTQKVEDDTNPYLRKKG